MKNINEQTNLRSLITQAVEDGRSITLRADPILTTSDATILQKQVFDGVDILVSPGEQFLRDLGVTFFPGLTGQFVVPVMTQDSGAFVSENAAAVSSDASVAAAITLVPRRISHTQAISKETLAQTNPAIYNSIIQNLVNGFWNCVANDLFDQVRVDCSSTNEKNMISNDGLTFTHLVNMEASLGNLMLAKPAYVVTPANRAYLSTTAKMTNQEGIWANDKINGNRAFAVPAQNANVVSYGDWSKACVGLWGQVNVIVDPFTDAKKGLINLTLEGLADTGVFNKRGIVNLVDVSCGR